MTQYNVNDTQSLVNAINQSIGSSLTLDNTALAWDFENLTGSNRVFSSTPSILEGNITNAIASQIGGGSLENIGGSRTLTTRQFGTTNYPFVKFTAESYFTLTGIEFKHLHNHNINFPTFPNYKLQLQLDSGNGFVNIGSPLTLNSNNSGSTDTISLEENIARGKYTIRWIPIGLNGSNTGSEFLAIDDLVISLNEIDVPSNSNILSLDGQNDYVQIRDSDAINFDTNQNFTVETWIKVDPNQADLRNSDNDIIEKWSGQDGYPFVIRYIRNSGKIQVARYDGSNNPRIFSNSTINDSQYHHIAFIKNGETLTLYIDGKPEGTTNDTTSNSTKNNSPLFLGRRGNNINYFKGNIDELRIWNIARTQEQIQADLNNTLTGNETGLVGYWNFDKDGSSNVVSDLSNINNNGTLNNGAKIDNENIIFISEYTPIIYEQNDTLGSFVGYVDLKLKQAVKNSGGIVVKYKIDGTSATQNVDFYTSQIDLSTSDSILPFNSVYIPQGQDSARIYFTALNDAIAENDETFTITLIENLNDPFNNPTNLVSYGVAPNSSVTITIKDSNNYPNTIAIADIFGDEVTINNPLVADKNGETTFQVKLTSQPQQNVTLNFNTNSGNLDIATITFDVNNWDSYQNITVSNLTLDNDNISEIIGRINVRSNNQIINQLNIVDLPTTVKLEVTEGGQENEIPLPQVSVIAINDAFENGNPGQFTIAIGNPAPENGLTIFYKLSNNSELKTALIEAGKTSVNIEFTKDNDSFATENKTLSLSLVENPEKYTISENKKATINLINDDVASVEFVKLNARDTKSFLDLELTSLNEKGNGNHDLSLNIALSEQPEARVTLIFNDTQNTELKFNENNWSQPKSINLTFLEETDWTAKIITSGETSTSLIELVPTAISEIVTTEGSNEHPTVYFRLTSEPTANVNVELNIENSNEGIFANNSYDNNYTFTPTNWNRYKSFTLFDRDDTDIDSNSDYTISVDVDSEDSNYNFVNSLSITNENNDETEELSNPVSVTSDIFISNIEIVNDTLKEGKLIDIPTNILSLDGQNDYVSLGNPQSLNINGLITIETWIKPEQTNDLRNIVARGYNLNPQGEVYLRINNGQYEIGSWNGTNYLTSYQIPSEDKGNWVHLAGVYDGNYWRLYRNGVEVSKNRANVGAVSVNNNWAIGARGTGTERFFKGNIDEVRIWNIARTQEQIQADLNNTLTGNETGLVGYWNFDKDGSSNVVSDLSNSNNNGTLNNGAKIDNTTTIFSGQKTESSQVIITLNQPAPQDLIVSYAANDNKAILGKDFTLPDKIVIPAGQQSVTVDVNLLEDKIDEPTEEIELQLGLIGLTLEVTQAYNSNTGKIGLKIVNNSNQNSLKLKVGDSLTFNNNAVITINQAVTLSKTEATIIDVTVTEQVTEIPVGELSPIPIGVDLIVSAIFDGENISLKLNNATKLDKVQLAEGTNLFFSGGAKFTVDSTTTVTKEVTLVPVFLADDSNKDNVTVGERTTVNANFSSATLTIIDDDIAGIKITSDTEGNNIISEPLITQEGDTNGKEFYISLTSKPTENVVIYVGSNNNGEGLLFTANNPNPEEFIKLSFLPDEWNKPQKVTLIPVDEEIDDGDITYQIITTVESEDFKYNEDVVTLKVDGNFVVDRDNNFKNNIKLSINNLNISETDLLKGTILTFSNGATFKVNQDVTLSNTESSKVNLKLIPQIAINETTEKVENRELIVTKAYDADTEIISLSINDDKSKSLTLPSGTLLTFSNGATVSLNEEITLKKDFDTQVNITFISQEVLSEEKTKFQENISPEITVINQNNDRAEVIVSATDTSATEGFSNNFYTVRLATQPQGKVEVKMMPSDDEIKLDNNLPGEALTITFDEVNWNVDRLVNVTAVDDFEVEFNHTSLINFQVQSLDDPINNNALLPNPIQVKIEDNDLPIARIQTIESAIEANKPGYFIISLDNKVPENFGETGLVVNYKIEGTAETNINSKPNGLFNIQAFRLLSNNNANDTQLNSTTETKAIWNKIDANFEQINNNISPTIISVGSNKYSVELANIVETNIINYGGGDGNFLNNISYNTINNNLVDNFSIRAKAKLKFTQGGTYTIAVGSDDARLIQLKGTTFTSASGQITTGINTDTLYFQNPTSHQLTLGTFTVNDNTILELDTFFWENGADDSFEVSIAEGQKNSFNTNDFKLLNDGLFGIKIDSTAPSSDLYTLSGSVRIAPGENNSPLIAFPIDDFLAEGIDLITNTKSTIKPEEGGTISLSLNEYPFTVGTNAYNAQNQTLKLKLNNTTTDRITTKLSQGTKLIFTGGARATVKSSAIINNQNVTEVKITLESGNINNNEIVYQQLTIPKGTKLNFGENTVIVERNSNISNQKPTAISVTLPDDIENNVIIKKNAITTLQGETVTITLESGQGYNLADASQGSLGILDNDKPGVQIFEVGDRTTVTENETSEFFVSLLSQPAAPVQVTLTSNERQAQVNFKIANYNETNNKVSLIIKDSDVTSLALSNKSKLSLYDNAGKLVATAKINTNPTGFFIDNENSNSEEPLVKLTQINLENGRSLTEATTATYSYLELGFADGVDNDGDGIKETLTLTFNSTNWYRPQTVNLQGIDDSVVEIGDFHTNLIDYSITSDDPDYNNFEVTPQAINIIDRTFDKENTQQSLTDGFLTLEDSINELSLPIIGKLEGVAPSFLDQFITDLITELQNTEYVTAETLQEAFNNAIALQDTGDFSIEITDLSKDNIAFFLNFNKEYQALNLSLDTDLGLPALGLEIAGELTSNFNFDLGLGFGINREDGFYINTEETTISAHADLILEDFTATGNLAFLQVDLEDIGTGLNLDFAVTLDNEEFTEDGQLTLTELQTLRNNNNLFDLVKYGFNGDAKLGFNVNTSFAGNAAFPSIDFDLIGELPLFNYSNQEDAQAEETPTLTIANNQNIEVEEDEATAIKVVATNTDANGIRLTKGTALTFDNVTVIVDENQIIQEETPTNIFVKLDDDGDRTNDIKTISQGSSTTLESSSFSLTFSDITLDFGEFLDNLVSPVVETINDIVEPIKPIVNTFNTEIKLLSDIGLASVFDRNNDGKATLLEVLLSQAGEQGDRYYQFANSIIQLIDLADTLVEIGEAGEINFGEYILQNFKGASNNPQDAGSALDTEEKGETSTNPQDLENQAQNSNEGSKFDKLKDAGFNIPLIEDPFIIINLLLGQDIDLITYDMPELDLQVGVGPFRFPVFPGLAGTLEGGLSANSDLVFGYDTFGLRSWADEDFSLADSYRIFDGFYLSDLDENGFDVNELDLAATIAAGLGLDLGVVRASINGGILGTVGLDVVDGGEYTGQSDGRIRPSEFLSQLVSNPLNLFDINGKVEAFLEAQLRVLFKTFTKSLARVTLFEFNTDNSNGRSSGAYLAGSTVFLDSNFNSILDEGEPVTLTNGEGIYSLEIPFQIFDLNSNGKIDETEGRLISFGGVDIFTGLTLDTPMYAPAFSTMITPLTTLQEQMMESGMGLNKSVKQIKEVLGLAKSIDLNNFDPIEAILEGDKKGIAVYASHIKIQSLFELTNKFFSEFIVAGGLSLDAALSEKVMNMVTEGIANIKTSIDSLNSEQLLEVYLTPLTELVSSYFPEELPLSQKQLDKTLNVWSEAVIREFNAVDNAIAGVKINQIFTETTPIKITVQSDLVELMGELGSGEINPDRAMKELNKMLPNGDVNDSIEKLSNSKAIVIGDRTITKSGIIGKDGTETVGNTDIDLYKVKVSKTGAYTIQTLNNFDFPADTYLRIFDSNGQEIAANDNANQNTTSSLITLKLDQEKIYYVGVNGASENADNYNPNNGNNIVAGSEGDYQISFSKTILKEGNNRKNTIKGNNKSELILGLNGNDKLLSNGGKDNLDGGKGNNNLNGGKGNDILIGGLGNDTLTGGKGSDIFVFNSPQDGTDMIKDFDPDRDNILINGSNFDSSMKIGNLQSQQFVLGNKAKDNNDRFIYNQNNGKLFYDPDGKGTEKAILLDQFDNAPLLDASNIDIF